MKKMVIGSVLLGSVFVMSGCTSGLNTSASEGQTTKRTGEISTSTTNEINYESNPIFEGRLIGDPVIDKNSVILSFESVDAVNDPESIHDVLDSNGVVLNVDKTIFDKTKHKEKFKQGALVEFTLTKTPALTYSIPPQVPGDSIKSVQIKDN
ncbi:hypothetical protein BW731_10410 [Vagococcus martis]|uniref:DUF5067 domain-containing protein n=1 Tax=Vagococcus martis TaxID=1768210 RepID=A0A1V4DJC5_9ENTE|nr:hypothetical protein [Vagococcus martis]OPF88551.1 hypothetical protein BW731_10410 [Vagococcus martis]